MVAGLEKLNEEHGSLPLAELLAPAIKYAEEGINLMPGQASRQASVQNMLLEFEGTRHYYIKANDTITYGPNDLLVQKDLAQTLRAIAANGADVFYKGEIAQKMVADIQAHGGAVTLESLENYEAKDALVLSGSYRGHDVYGLWMPSFGAITIEILQILENLPMADYTEAEWASAMYQALNIAYEDRYKQTSLEVGERLIDKDYAREQATRIHVGKPVEVSHTAFEQDEYLAYSNALGHTTHLSVADKNGMIISLTQSLGPIMGSRVVTPGLGFLHAATLGGYLGPMEPGQRAASHISPMILASEGEPFIGIGAAGGAKINSAIVQAISRIVDRDMGLLEALAAPRVHPLKEGMALEVPDSLSWNPEDYQFLRDNGFVIKEENRPFRFGRVHVVMKSGANWLGAADPDGEGAAAGPKR
jgi:gamma-glutamyltranspeptidase/glutathione hydrolase